MGQIMNQNGHGNENSQTLRSIKSHVLRKFYGISKYIKNKQASKLMKDFINLRNHGKRIQVEQSK